MGAFQEARVGDKRSRRNEERKKKEGKIVVVVKRLSLPNARLGNPL